MIIIDTHAWLWLLHDPSQLSSAARVQIEIEEAQNGILVSAISVWEIAVKSSIGKLALPSCKDNLVGKHLSYRSNQIALRSPTSMSVKYSSGRISRL